MLSQPGGSAYVGLTEYEDDYVRLRGHRGAYRSFLGLKIFGRIAYWSACLPPNRFSDEGRALAQSALVIIVDITITSLTILPNGHSDVKPL
jgi:hypothetical protein